MELLVCAVAGKILYSQQVPMDLEDFLADRGYKAEGLDPAWLDGIRLHPGCQALIRRLETDLSRYRGFFIHSHSNQRYRAEE